MAAKGCADSSTSNLLGRGVCIGRAKLADEVNILVCTVVSYVFLSIVAVAVVSSLNKTTSLGKVGSFRN